MIQEIIFWKNHPALHDHRLYKALSAYCRFSLICNNPTPQRRIVNSGWSSETGIETVFLSELPSPEAFVARFIQDRSRAVHVLCGLRGCRSVQLALPHLLNLSHPKLAVCQEAPTKTSGIKKIGQTLAYRHLLRRIRGKVGAFFTMGEMGRNAYQKLGFPAEKIYPAMYSYPGNYPELPPPAFPRHPIRLIYVGEAVSAKGVPLLLQVMKSFPADLIHLTLAGSDPDGILSRALAAVSLKDRLTVLGVVPNKNILDLLADQDLLILPSFNDGWGMVVTEALIAGIGSIVTDACGSQDIPRKFGTGLVIPARSASAIFNALKTVIEAPQILFTWKQNARLRRDETRPELIAKQMFGILNRVFPSPPSDGCTPF